MAASASLCIDSLGLGEPGMCSACLDAEGELFNFDFESGRLGERPTA